jgi:hypothetical protein
MFFNHRAKQLIIAIAARFTLRSAAFPGYGFLQLYLAVAAMSLLSFQVSQNSTIPNDVFQINCHSTPNFLNGMSDWIHLFSSFKHNYQ